MDMEAVKSESSPPKDIGNPPMDTQPRGHSRWIILLLCVAIVGLGAAVYAVMIKSSPKARKRPPVKIVPLVTVQEIFPKTQRVTIKAMGTVVPAKELTLKSRVAGEIVQVHPEFTVGGILRKGEQILQIDETDYKLIKAQRQSAVVDADFAYKLELGRQDVAQREWNLLNGNNPAPEADAALALRKPHLEKALSDLAAARSELEAAKLQLARTKIVAPFNAVIRSTDVEKGSMTSVQENLATLVGTDDYWVQVAVPIDRLKWIDIPNDYKNIGADASVSYHGDAVRQGRVIKLLSDLEEQGRMARLVVSVRDPLGINSSGENKPAMLIGEYVRVEIKGRQIEEAYPIPRAALRDNTHIWLADADNKLEFREVQTIWRDSEKVLIKNGLTPGSRLIISDLATPVPGMAIQVEKGAGKSTNSTANVD